MRENATTLHTIRFGEFIGHRRMEFIHINLSSRSLADTPNESFSNSFADILFILFFFLNKTTWINTIMSVKHFSRIGFMSALCLLLKIPSVLKMKIMSNIGCHNFRRLNWIGSLTGSPSIHVHLNGMCFCVGLSTWRNWIRSVLLTRQCQRDLIKLFWISATCFSQFSISINHRYVADTLYPLVPTPAIAIRDFPGFRKAILFSRLDRTTKRLHIHLSQ